MTTATADVAASHDVAPNRLARFRRWAVTTCAATYFLIWLGGLVRVSGAGLGCPDWPRCFGRWIPPTDVSQIPASIDPSLFNVTLAWIEYVNRLAGVVVGLLILGTAFFAVRDLRRVPTLVGCTVAAALLVAFQGWLGSVVVSSLLEPWIVTAHLVLALIIISLLVWASVRAWRLEHPDDGEGAAYPRGARAGVALVWLLALVQIGLGAWLRGAIEHQIDEFPLRGDRELIQGLGWPGHIHLVLGILVAVVATWIGVRMIYESRNASWLVRFGTRAMLTLVGLQLVIGLCFVAFGIPAAAQLFHSWVASLLIGALLILAGGLGGSPSTTGAPA